MLRQSITALCSILIAGSAFAMAPTEVGKTGVGLQVGTLSAVTMKRTLSERNAWDVALGTQDQEILATTDYLWYTPQVSVIHPYVGIGAGVAVETEDDLSDDQERIAGVGRIPLGISYYPEQTNLNASLQLTPMFKTLGESEVAAAVSLLYYFQ